ncbi:hypothetical protein SARC_13038, partial [Sphaeroforma arctica JP610]
ITVAQAQTDGKRDEQFGLEMHRVHIEIQEATVTLEKYGRIRTKNSVVENAMVMKEWAKLTDRVTSAYKTWHCELVNAPQGWRLDMTEGILSRKRCRLQAIELPLGSHVLPAETKPLLQDIESGQLMSDIEGIARPSDIRSENVMPGDIDSVVVMSDYTSANGLVPKDPDPDNMPKVVKGNNPGPEIRLPVSSLANDTLAGAKDNTRSSVSMGSSVQENATDIIYVAQDGPDEKSSGENVADSLKSSQIATDTKAAGDMGHTTSERKGRNSATDVPRPRPAQLQINTVTRRQSSDNFGVPIPKQRPASVYFPNQRSNEHATDNSWKNKEEAEGPDDKAALRSTKSYHAPKPIPPKRASLQNVKVRKQNSMSGSGGSDSRPVSASLDGEERVRENVDGPGNGKHEYQNVDTDALTRQLDDTRLRLRTQQQHTPTPTTNKPPVKTPREGTKKLKASPQTSDLGLRENHGQPTQRIPARPGKGKEHVADDNVKSVASLRVSNVVTVSKGVRELLRECNRQIAHSNGPVRYVFKECCETFATNGSQR